MKHRGSGAKPAEKPRLVPHGRSPLHFLIECIRLREWELAAFPAWAETDTVRNTLHDTFRLPTDGDFAIGIRERHASRRHKMLESARRGVEADVARLAPGLALPAELADELTSQRFQDCQTRQSLRSYAITTSRNARTSPTVADRQRMCKAFAGLFVTYGGGHLARTAEIARQHTPTKDANRTAQPWHARNALGSIARELRPPIDDAAVLRLVGFAADVRELALRSIHAWNCLRAMPGYSRELNHERLIVETIGTGQLGAWLDEPLRIPDDHPTLGVTAAARRLVDHVASYHGIAKPARRKRVPDVSARKIASRNAIAPAAS